MIRRIRVWGLGFRGSYKGYHEGPTVPSRAPIMASIQAPFSGSHVVPSSLLATVYC